MEEISNPNLVRPLTVAPQDNKISFKLIIGGVAVAALTFGALTGFGIYKSKSSPGTVINGKQVEVVKTEGEEGVKDASMFKDTATGELKANDGKITKEGSHVLVRGNVSQNVYLTSSVVDMDKYVGQKIQIWGETFKGQKAGWFMDVGRIKVTQ